MPASDVMLACVSLCFHHSRPEVPLNASHASDKEKYLQAKMVRERRRFHPTSWCHRFNLPVQLRPGSTDSHSGIDGGLGAVPNETFLPSGFRIHLAHFNGKNSYLGSDHIRAVGASYPNVGHAQRYLHNVGYTASQ